jgi:hypothetical protein
LLVRDAGGGLTDLAREVIIGSLHRGAAGCPFRRRLAYRPIGLTRPIEDAVSECFSESAVVGSTGCGH